MQWLEVNSNAPWAARDDHTSIAFNNELWVIAGQGNGLLNDVWYSSNGANWNEATGNAAFSPRDGQTSLVYNNLMWVIGGQGTGGNSDDFNDVWYSSNGADWTEATGNAAFSPRWLLSSVVYDNKMWVIGGASPSSSLNDVWSSSDGINWTYATLNAGFSPRAYQTAVVYNNYMWVIGSSSLNDVWRSSDGINWTETSNGAFPISNSYIAYAWAGEMYLFAEGTSQLYSSIDGVTWNLVPITGTVIPSRIVAAGTVFNNQIWATGGMLYSNYSYDNTVWTLNSTCSSATPTYTITMTATISPTPTWTNTPCSQWQWTEVTSNAAWSPRDFHTSVAFNNEMWVIAGNTYSNYMNDVWYSSDGVNWGCTTTAANFTARAWQSSVVYNNEMWVIAGVSGGAYLNDVWYSSDGVNWQRATLGAQFSIRAGLGSVVFNNEMWVIGGFDGSYYNDVWNSSNGITWNQVTGTAGFSGREYFSTIVYNNKMWVIGGTGNSGSLSDVWSSSDGITWTQTSSNAFPASDSNISFVWGGFMYVFDENNSQLYVSSDGITWSLVSITNTPPNMHYGAKCVYNNALWVTGGKLLSGNDVNTVWELTNSCSGTFSSTKMSSLTKPIATETPVVENFNEKTVYNYPNPVKDSTIIRFPLKIQQEVSIVIYDINGKVVWTKELNSAGTFIGINTVVWNVRNDMGVEVSNGVYLLRVKTKNNAVTKKIAVIK